VSSKVKYLLLAALNHLFQTYIYEKIFTIHHSCTSGGFGVQSAMGG
jgi:hypothetical protein